MSGTFPIAGRELRSYFLTPVGYIIIALFLLLTGLIFVFFTFEQGQPASMRSVFAWGTWVLLFVCPAISMRTLSEESRMGTIEMLMTSPVSEREVVLGKFLAALGFLIVMFLPTGIHAVVLELYGRPDYGELACGYLGMMLAGSAYVASGMLASALTSSQVVAFLLPLFFWLIINLGCKLAPPYVNEFWAGIAVACDADQRLREFTIGLLDTSNVVFFITLTSLFLIIAVRSLEAREVGVMAAKAREHAKQAPPRPASRLAQTANLLLFLLGVLGFIISLNFFAHREGFRQRIDATKTRAYSLSEQSRQLLASLQGEWAIAVVLSQDNVDRAVRRQIDEVLERYTDASKNITIVRIDPADPQSLNEHQGLVADLHRVYRDEIDAYDAAINGGLDAFAALRSFAQQQAAVLEQVVERMPEDDPIHRPLAQRAGLLALLADQAPRVFEEIDKARRTDESKPIADYEVARSILAEALTQWAGQLDELSNIFTRWRERPNIDESVRNFTVRSSEAHSQMARQLAEAADPLKRLEPLELATIGAELQKGEAVVVVGPDRAAVIPSWQLFPQQNQRSTGDGVVTFDRRFRGEQIISSTLRSLSVKHMPKVVFVHGNDSSMLRQQERNADLIGAASMLNASRYEVEEWMIAQDGERPKAAEGQPIVWVIIPSAQRSGLQPSKNELALLNAVQQLLDEGQPVLLNCYPSMLSQYGQVDPWSVLAADFGLKVETGTVIFQRLQGAEKGYEKRQDVQLQEFNEENILGRAIAGQLVNFTWPLPVRVAENKPQVRTSIIAAVNPGEFHWLEKNWSVDPATLPDPAEDAKVRHPVPVAMSAEREISGGKPQRIVVVGSVGWTLRFIADSMLSLGGGRAVLQYPGNHELLLASVAWLANMDDLIAASPVSQGVARLSGIPEREMAFWRYFLTIGVPVACLVIGLVVYLRRS